MNVSIFTEGFKNTGYGHLTRCISIYQAFEEAGAAPALFVYGDNAAKIILKGLNYNIVDWIGDESDFINSFSGSDVSVIDSYLAKQELYYRISSCTDVSVFIDDYSRIDYPHGIVVNGTISADDFFRQKETNFCLLGSKYIPLRKEFWNIPRKKIKDKIDTVLITMGGQDIRNLTPPFLKYFAKNYPDLKKIVVAGPGFGNIKEIKDLSDNNTVLIENADAADLRELMIEADFAVTAGGQTLYELACVGLPPVVAGAAENQRYNIEGWEKTGFIDFAGWWDDPDMLNKMGKIIKKLESRNIREEKSNTGKQYVDGQGSRRVVKRVISELAGKNGFYLKKADTSDTKKVFKLSNRPDVRRQSVNENEILWEDHLNWFSKKITDPGYVFFVAYNNNDFISQIRFEINNEEAIIAISIEKNYRGKGLGARIIDKACKEVFYQRSGVKKILAYIKPDNVASIRSFIKAGFEYSGQATLNSRTFNLYILKRK